MNFTDLFKWQNYMHYALLIIAIILFVQNVIGTEIYTGAKTQGLVCNPDNPDECIDYAQSPYEHLEPYFDAFLLFLFVVVADSLIHIIFKILPEPLRWDD